MRSKIKLYTLQFILMFILLSFLIIPNLINKEWILALVLFLYALIIKYLITVPVRLDIRAKKITKFIIVTALLYLALFYTFGMYTGFYHASKLFGINTILKYILPISVIIISSEYIRFKFISIETKLSRIINFIDMVLIDICIYYKIFYIFKTITKK